MQILDEINPANSDIQTMAKGAGLSIIGKVIGRVLSFLGDIILARTLGASIFGLYSIGWTVFRLLQLVVPLGLPQGLIKFIPGYVAGQKPELIKGLIISSYILVIVSGVLVGGILYKFSPMISTSIFNKPELSQVLRYFSFIFPFSAILSVAAAASRSTRQLQYSVFMEDIGQPLIVVGLFALTLIFANLDINKAIWIEAVSFIVTASLGLIIVRKLFAPIFKYRFSFAISQLKPLLLFSIPTSIAGVFSVFVFWIDRLIVGSMLPSAENGIYQVLSQLSMIFVILYASFNAILGPIFAKLFAEGEKQRLGEVYRVGTKWNFYLGIIPFIIYVLLSKDILQVFFGSDYVSGWLPLIVLGFGQLINCATGSIGVLLMMVGHQKIWFWMSAISLVLNSVLCVILIPVMGLLGAAIATSIAVGGINFIATIYARHKIGIWPYDWRYLKAIIAGFFAAIVGFFLPMWEILPFVKIILVSIIILICFFLILFLLRFEKEDDLLISTIKVRLGQ